jgi:hypothetical protein
MSLFKEHTDEQQAHALAAYLPNGKLWTGKNKSGSNFRNLLIGTGKELTRVEQKLNEILNECDISQATVLIGEWEKLLGIPDEAIPMASTLEGRRSNVLFKLSVFGAYQEADYVRIAQILGFNVTVTPADGGPDIPYVDWRVRYIIVVTVLGTSTTWPWTWPLLWGGMDISVLQAMFEKIRPAVCEIIWRTGP